MKSCITFTEKAGLKLKNLLSKKTTDTYIKLGVKRRGCNGLSYTLNYCLENEKQKFDEVINNNGIKMIVDNSALWILIGTKMDYIEDLIRSEFIFINPNSKGSCGCGESFHI